VKKHFKLIVKTALISVYVIFIAGSVVRMTGSGMGCPDWPKCFGYYIPPTDEEQLVWKPLTNYKEGTIIIIDKALYVANSQISTGPKYNTNNWSKYTKHDYAIFNVYHTWTEYINRLSSAVAGLFFLVLIIASLKYRKDNIKIPLLAFASFFLMLF
jgi:cytochrome c oxidase assembly protein subunit 15